MLLVAATTGYQVRSYGEAADRVGAKLILATDRCHILEDPWRDGAVPVRFDDPMASAQQVREATRDDRPDGVTAVGDRPAVLAAAVAEALGLRGHPLSAAQAAGNKLATRQRLASAGLRGPWFRRFPLAATASEMVGAGVAFPCVIKPLSMAASRGVMRVDTPRELAVAQQRLQALLAAPDVRARRDPANEEMLVEGYVEGREVAVEGVVTAGGLQLLAVFDKPDRLEGPFFEETIYVTSTAAEDLPRIQRAVEAAVEALGLTDGPIHAECRLNEGGVYVLEVAARPIGGLCARVLRFDGPDGRKCSLEELLLRHALTQSVVGYRRETQAAGVMMIPIPADGRLKRVDGLEAAQGVPGVDEVVISAKAGQRVQPPPEGDTYLGFIFARAAQPEAVVSVLRAAHAALRFEIEPVLDVRLDGR